MSTLENEHGKGFDSSLIDNPTDNPNVGLFTVKTANQVIDEAKNRPMPGKLFGQLWFEREVCILFSDSNLGKSILAVQIADGISRGRSVLGLATDLAPQPVLYCDFELSDKQFELRYMSDDGSSHHRFSENLLRVEIDPDADIPEGCDTEDIVKQSLEQVVKKRDVKIIIIDNITFLNRDTEKSKDALPLMKWLKTFGRKNGLSLLVLAHTPKRNLSMPITKNDLAGSKMLYNFCDGCFAIGESTRGKSVRFIKELKQRNLPFLYDSENVIVCEIEKLGDFLQFQFVEYGREADHLRQMDETKRNELMQRVKELDGQGKTQREIANELKMSLGTVNNYLKKMEKP